jgi:hypothetical protein
MHQPQNQVLFFFVLSPYKFTVIFVVLQMFFGFGCSYSMTANGLQIGDGRAF